MDNKQQKELLKAGIGCLSILGLIILGLILIIIFDKPIEPEEIKPAVQNKQVSDGVLDFGYIQFTKDDLPFLEKFKEQYFKRIEVAEYDYNCYIDPDAWNTNQLDGKETLFIRCAAYGAIKTGENEKGSTHALVSTHIRSNANGEELGSFTINGYKFK